MINIFCHLKMDFKDIFLDGAFPNLEYLEFLVNGFVFNIKKVN